MPLHRTAKGDSPDKALSQLIRRIEHAGGTVVQTIDLGDQWGVQATAPPREPRAADVDEHGETWETR